LIIDVILVEEWEWGSKVDALKIWLSSNKKEEKK
jgi:hypothetical protein